MSLPRVNGRITRIARGAVHDGPGLRTVVFLKGCPLRCRWCHSPETQALQAEVALFRERCIGCGSCVAACEHDAARLTASGPAIDRDRCVHCGRCIDACPAGVRQLEGADIDTDAVMAVVRRDVPFYDGSGGGVTFSGGEPLLQPEFLATLLMQCAREGIHTAVETCGHATREAVLRVLRASPLFLFDLKIAEDARHRKATGVSNQRILSNLRFVANHAETVVRFPLVPGVTDDEDNVASVASIAVLAGVRRIDVLPYHRAGTAKYTRLDRDYPLDATAAATPEEAENAALVMRKYGLDVRVGGSS